MGDHRQAAAREATERVRLDQPVLLRVGSNSAEQPPVVVLEVVDHGPGLPPEVAERVFERFYRADDARDRDAGGSGLGLAIAAGVVRAHGGRVEVESSPGEGSTFRVMLPLA